MRWSGLVFLNVRFGPGRFSKTGHPHKHLFMRLMGRISTFQATTVTATSICLFFSCFLEAVIAVDGDLWQVSASHTTTVVSTKKSVALEASSPLESSRR
jgi:hypothetical protein